MSWTEPDSSSLSRPDQLFPAGEHVEHYITSHPIPFFRGRDTPDADHLVLASVLFDNAPISQLDGVNVVEAETGGGPGTELRLGFYDVPKGGMEGLVLVGADKSKSALELFRSHARLDEEAHAVPASEALQSP